MGVNLFIQKQKRLRDLGLALYDIEIERSICVRVWTYSDYFKNKYDLDTYLIMCCSRLKNLYSKADLLVKHIV